MPIFRDLSDIVTDIQSSRGVQYSPNFRLFCEDLHFKITGKKAKFKEGDPLSDYRNEMYQTFQFNKASYVEPDLRDVTEIHGEESETEKLLPSISYRIFKSILFDPLNRGSLNVVTAPSGSGKSILLDSLKHDILHEEHLSSYIPLLINLENLKVEKKDLFEDIYDFSFPNTDGRYMTNFESSVKSGKVIFLLDSLTKTEKPKDLLKKLYNFVIQTNARMIMTCRPIVHEYIRKSSKIEKNCHLYELNTFKASALFEWVILNKQNFEQTRHHQARDIYLILKETVKQKEERGERVELPTLMKEFSI